MQDIGESLPDNIPADYNIADQKYCHFRSRIKCEQTAGSEQHCRNDNAEKQVLLFSCHNKHLLSVKHRLPFLAAGVQLFLRLDRYIRLNLFDKRLGLSQNCVEAVIRSIQNHLLAQKVHFHVIYAVDFLYGFLNLGGTVAAVKVDQLNGLFHHKDPLSF